MTAGTKILAQIVGSELVEVDTGGAINPKVSVATIVSSGAEAYQTNSATSTTSLTVNNVLSGLQETVLQMTGTLGAAATATLPGVAAIVAALPDARAGQTWRLRVMNTSGANFGWTIAAGSGGSTNGTMTVAQNAWRDFILTLTSLSAYSIQNAGGGTT